MGDWTATSSSAMLVVRIGRILPDPATESPGNPVFLVDSIRLGFATSDSINALLLAAAHNLRLVLTVLALWLVWFLQASQPKNGETRYVRASLGCVA